MVSLPLRSLVFALLLAAGATCAWSQKIYTCIDSKGRRLTSDRPIMECADREQKELSETGTVRRTVGPSLTPAERAAKEEEERKVAADKQRVLEEKRRERAMLGRYPNQASHDAERAKALNAVQEVILAANRRSQDLQEQRQKLMVEMEFYKGDLSKAPPKLRRQVEETQEHLAGQARFLANQEDEKRRVNARFDAELARLRVLWDEMKQAGAAPSQVSK